jgi:hypothetical protein
LPLSSRRSASCACRELIVRMVGELNTRGLPGRSAGASDMTGASQMTPSAEVFCMASSCKDFRWKQQPRSKQHSDSAQSDPHAPGKWQTHR